MAAIQKRNGRYRARVIRKGFASFSKTFQTHREAVSWSRLIETQIDQGLISPAKKKSIHSLDKSALFKEVAEIYIKTHSIHKKNYKSEAGILRILSRRWQDLTVAQINKPVVMELRDDLLRVGRAGNTINHYFNAISKVFQMLEYEFELMLSNPVKGLHRMPQGPGRNKRLSIDAEKLLIDGCNKLNLPLLRHIIEFAIQTGMRRGEMMSLTWADIDIANRKAYLHNTKNGAARQVPLTLRVIELLRALPQTESNVFPITFDGLRSQFKRLRSHLRQSWDGYGANPFNDLRFHDFRHEALSRLSDAGLNVIELSHISGHKTLAMLQRYTHPSHEAILKKLP